MLGPYGCPTDEVGCKIGHGFLQVDGRFGTHFQAMEEENLFGLFDPGFNGLADIVLAEPGFQVSCYRGVAEGNQ